MTDVHVKGLDEIERRLKAMPKKMATRVLNKAIRKGANVIARQVRADAPFRTGAIKRNVLVKRGRRDFDNGLEARYVIGVQHGKVRTEPTKFKTKKGVRERKLTAYDRRGQDPFYFRFQELGFHAVGTRKREVVDNKFLGTTKRVRATNVIRGGGSARFVSGKKFMTNALPRARGQAIDAVVKSMREDIAKGALK